MGQQATSRGGTATRTRAFRAHVAILGGRPAGRARPPVLHRMQPVPPSPRRPVPRLSLHHIYLPGCERGRNRKRLLDSAPTACVAGLESLVPYACLAVEIDEQAGVIVMGNLLGVPADSVGVGMRVQVCFEPLGEDDLVLPQFRPLGMDG